ncbi:MAG: hypothetical protein MHM6MM_002377 [Cercozoa sp. M6MM]
MRYLQLSNLTVLLLVLLLLCLYCFLWALILHASQDISLKNSLFLVTTTVVGAGAGDETLAPSSDGVFVFWMPALDFYDAKNGPLTGSTERTIYLLFIACNIIALAALVALVGSRLVFQFSKRQKNSTQKKAISAISSVVKTRPLQLRRAFLLRHKSESPELVDPNVADASRDIYVGEDDSFQVMPAEEVSSTASSIFRHEKAPPMTAITPFQQFKHRWRQRLSRFSSSLVVLWPLSFFVFVALILIGAIAFSQLETGFDFWDALYYTIALGVGSGAEDLAVGDSDSRTFAMSVIGALLLLLGNSIEAVLENVRNRHVARRLARLTVSKWTHIAKQIGGSTEHTSRDDEYSSSLSESDNISIESEDRSLHSALYNTTTSTGGIQRHAFALCMLLQMELVHPRQVQQLLALFDRLDTNRDGELTPEEIVAAERDGEVLLSMLEIIASTRPPT